MNEKLVSIIIRTKNEEKWISACLRSVFKQTYKNIEVIIVDNESTDRTVIKAQEFPVKIVNIKEFIPGKAINDGIRASSGEYIVCLSGHCIPVNNQWLENLVKDLSASNIAGVYGRQEPLSFTSDLDKRDLLTVFGLDKKIQTKDSFFHNANSAFSREIWDKYPFNETLTNIEDRVWGEKVVSKGLNIIYEPEASVYHWHGIHQDLNPERAKNIVKILEGLKTINTTSKHQKPEDLKILAVIPVRGESCLMNNKPLLKNTIESAKYSKFITDIIVATDSEKTALLSKSMGIEAPFIRPEELSEDYVDVFDVVEYTVDWLEQQHRHYDVIVLLEEVYPFRPKRMIDEMISKLILEGYDTVVAGAPETRGIWIDDSNKVELLGEEVSISMPSSLKELKTIVGLLGLCCVTHSASLRNNIIFSGKVGIVEINDPFALVAARNKNELALASIIDKSLS
jgi:glycosyltransferase involved in cell wall biosynthesis